MIPAPYRTKGGGLLLGARRPGEAGPFGRRTDIEEDQGDEETPVTGAPRVEAPRMAEGAALCPACEAQPPADDPARRHRRYLVAVAAAIEQRESLRYETGALRRAAVGPLHAARDALRRCPARE
ncbi:hypothetical protein AB0O22_12845 [Streptomyces sp. NPDC091204]|uniref:hypothetical protein n=1 Tax=Streptomyces sp. NPDC091204 TaxID=3155299 RepID=UPI00341EBE38